MYPDVFIAGGGIIGCSIAWRLAQRGCRVTIADAGRLGGQASWAGAGMLSPGGEVDSDSPWSRRCVDSLRMYPGFIRELEQEARLPIDFRLCGSLELACSEFEHNDAARKAAARLALDIPSEPLTPSEAASLVPELDTRDLASARHYPRDAAVDPRHIVAALAKVLRARGVTILEGRPVTRVPSGITVLAAGAWSSRIFPGAPPSSPVKGHLIGYDLPPGSVPVILRHGHTYILQRGTGFTIAGSTTEQAGFDTSVDPRIVQRLHERAHRLLPRILRSSPDTSWTGLRPYAEPGEPQVGRFEDTDIWLAYGHYRNGILLAPITAAMIAGGITASSGMD
jgi:glycine oxidase